MTTSNPSPAMLFEGQAMRQIIRIGDQMKWTEGSATPLTKETFSYFCNPELAIILFEAHQTCVAHRHLLNDSDVPALKILNAMVSHIFSKPAWDRACEVPVTAVAQKAWLDGQAMYTESLYYLSVYRKELLGWGMQQSWVDKFMKISCAGGPRNEAERQFAEQVNRFAENCKDSDHPLVCLRHSDAGKAGL